MEQEPSSEIAGRAATRVAAGSIVGYAGHLPGWPALGPNPNPNPNPNPATCPGDQP